MGVKDGGWWMMDVGCESHTPVTEFWTFNLSWLELDQIKFQSLIVGESNVQNGTDFRQKLRL